MRRRHSSDGEGRACSRRRSRMGCLEMADETVLLDEQKPRRSIRSTNRPIIKENSTKTLI